MKIKGNDGITLVALIITLIILVILTAVVVNTINRDNLIETVQTGARAYSYEQEKEKISDALYQALLQSLIAESFTIDYKQVPENVTKILNENGQFECELVSDDNGYSIYNVKPIGKNFYFVLEMSHEDGTYELYVAE